MPLSNVISPAPRDVWKALLQTDPEAVPYQSPNWADAACQSGHFKDISRLYQFSDGRQYVLPLLKSRGVPDFLAIAGSMPHNWGMGGLVGGDTLNPEDISAIFSDLQQLPYLRVGIRPNPRMSRFWEAGEPDRITIIPRVAHVIDLEGGFEKVWAERFSKKTRRSINRAENLGVAVDCDSAGAYVPIFYELMVRSFDRWAHRQHEPILMSRWRNRIREPYSKFEKIAQNMGNACHIWVAWVDGKPAAASLVLQYNNANANSSRSVMDADVAGHSGANDLIKKHAIMEACQSGCRFFHLGETGFSDSLSFYKTRLGAEAYPYREYYIEHFPVTKLNQQIRNFVKRRIGYKDPSEIEVVEQIKS